MQPDEVKHLIASISKACRDLLDQATKDVGCGINAKKSEIVVPPAYEDSDLKFKADFTWLGYSLHLSDDCYLLLTPMKMNQRFETCRRLIMDTFQYIRDISVRRQIFMVYISPVIVWFLPVVMLEPANELAKANKCGKFQHDMLALTLNVTRNCSAEALHEILATHCRNFDPLGLLTNEQSKP